MDTQIRSNEKEKGQRGEGDGKKRGGAGLKRGEAKMLREKKRTKQARFRSDVGY